MARTNNFSIIDKLGTDIYGAMSLSEALKKADLSWNARDAKVSYQRPDGTYGVDDNHRVLFRDDNGSYLGIVGNKYKTLQNDEAFAVAEGLLGEMQFVRGGQFGGQTSITLRAPDTEIEGDAIKNYVTIRNSFDGSSKVQFCLIPVRQVCENGLCVEIPGSRRIFELPHVGNVSKKYQQLFIENSLGDQTEAIKRYAAALLKIKCGPTVMTEILDKFFPINLSDDEDLKVVSTRMHNKNLELRAQIAYAMGQDDLANFSGTAYQIFQAFCDFETHSQDIISSDPKKAANQQFLRAFTGFSITAGVMNYLIQRKA